MQISKRQIAREWLIFLALFPFGFASCFLLGYYWSLFRTNYFSAFYLRHHYVGHYPYDDFWNDAFGLVDRQTLALWFVPYLAVTLVRSILWSIGILKPEPGQIHFPRTEPKDSQTNEEIDSNKPRQAQLKIWGIPVGTPPLIAPVPERITPSYAWRSLVIFALAILLLILLMIWTNK
jgi:hypothetical protein